MREGYVYKRCGTCLRDVAKHGDCKGRSADARWAFRVDIAPPGAPRQQRFKGGFSTKREALDALNALQDSVKRGRYVEPSRQTVGEYLEGWLPSARSRLAPGAFDACELHVRTYIVPRIGDVPLQSLRKPQVRALYAELETSGRVRGEGGLSRKSVWNVHRTLSRALNDAVEDGLLERNEASKAYSQPQSPEQPTWSAQQLAAFFRHVADDRLFALWRVAASTGLRRGELVGLRWSDVDLDGARLLLSQQRAKGAGGVQVGPLKGKRGRLVSLDAGTVMALRVHRQRQLEDRLAWGPSWQDTGLVFVHEDGSALHPDSVTKRFARLVKSAALPTIKLHSLRHTHATLLLLSGEHPRVVQERLGHSSALITLDVYSHVTAGMQEEAAARVAAIVDAANLPDLTGEESQATTALTV